MELIDKILVALSAFVVAIILATQQALKTYIHAWAERQQKTLSFAQIHLHSHPIFSTIQPYIINTLASYNFAYRVRQQLVVDYEKVRWVVALSAIKKIISYKDFNDVMPSELENRVMSLSIDVVQKRNEILIGNGYPKKALYRFNQELKDLDGHFYTAFKNAMQSKALDGMPNSHRYWLFLDSFVHHFHANKHRTLLSLASANGELERLEYKPKQDLNYNTLIKAFAKDEMD